MQKVLVTKEIPRIAYDILERSGICVDSPSKMGLTQTEISNKIHQYDGIITMMADSINEQIINNATNLKVISNFAVGINNIDIAACSEKNIVVTNTPDVLTTATAELALTLLMACSRRLKEAQQFIEQGKWERWETIELLGPALNGKTLGIMGMGRIGEAFADKCAKALDMKVIYHNRNKKHVPHSWVDFETLLKQSDAISIHCPLTAETKFLFNKSSFEKMKKSAILINTSRGQVCHTDDLYNALANGEIFAAGLDVTDPEPLPNQHPLYQLPNCLITPHIGSATTEARDGMARLCAENIVNVLNGKPALNPVN